MNKTSPFFRQFSKPPQPPQQEQPPNDNNTKKVKEKADSEQGDAMSQKTPPLLRGATTISDSLGKVDLSHPIPRAATDNNFNFNSINNNNFNPQSSTPTTTTTTTTTTTSTSTPSTPSPPTQLNDDNNGQEKKNKSNRATNLASKTAQKYRKRAYGSSDAATIAQAQKMIGDTATSTAQVVLTKRTNTAVSTPAQVPPHAVLSIPSITPSSTQSKSSAQSPHKSSPSPNVKPSTTVTPSSSPSSSSSSSSTPVPMTRSQSSRSRAKKQPLSRAERKQFESMLELIEVDGRSLPLIWASKTCIIKFVEFILTILNREGINIDINHQDGSGKTALHYAAARGYSEVCELLLKNGAEVSIPDTDWHIPLHLATRQKNAAIVEMLLKYGANIGTKDSRGLTVLHTTAGSGEIPLMTLLAKYCRQPLDSFRDKFGRTCLFSSIKYHKRDMVEYLVNNHTDPCLKDKYGINCIHYCAMEMKTMFKCMIHAIQNKYPTEPITKFIDSTDKSGRTAICYACRKGSKEPIKVSEKLIQLGANLNVQDGESGDTPLHLAAGLGSVYLVQLLLNNGASPDVRNKAGELPVDVAVHAEILSTLKKITAASPKRKRADSDSDDEHSLTATDPEPRKRAIEILKMGFAKDFNPDKKRKEAAAFVGGDDDSTILADQVTSKSSNFSKVDMSISTEIEVKKASNEAHDIKHAVHHFHLSTTNNNNNNNNNNFINNIVSNNNTTNNNNTNTNTNNNSMNSPDENTTKNNKNNNNNNTNNNTHNGGPATETYTASAPLDTQATPFPLGDVPLSVTLGPLAQQFLIIEKDLVLGEALGTGSFGEVVKGTWKERDVAIKCMHKNLQATKQAVQLYVNEIEIMCRVRHPNVVRIFGCTQPPQVVYIVMEYYPSNLLQLIQKWVRIPVPFLLKIAKGIANGLFYLHTVAKIIHRDMKPSNVLLDDDNTPKIADFGVARENAGTLTMTGIGTPTYMAPEMLKSRKYSDKVDVYSFGLILWQMYTGEKPYADLKMNDGQEMSPVQIAVKVATERIRPKIPPDCPPTLHQLITQCWAHDPRKRLSSEELVSVLEHC